LTLRKIHHMQPDEILYSMPTICDELPRKRIPAAYRVGGRSRSMKLSGATSSCWGGTSRRRWTPTSRPSAKPTRHASGRPAAFAACMSAASPEPRLPASGSRLATSSPHSARAPRCWMASGCASPPGSSSADAMRCGSGLVAYGYARKGRVVVLGLDPWTLAGDPTADAQAPARRGWW
jgi:hypothetical protein